VGDLAVTRTITQNFLRLNEGWFYLSNRTGYALAVIVLLISAGLRFYALATVPPGFTDAELTDVRLTEAVRAGNIRVFYDVDGAGREGLYPVLLAASTTVTGGGLIGYRMLSYLAGMVTLALIYALGRRLFGAGAAITAMAVFGISLFPILLARGITRETLLPLYITGTLLALARALPIYGTADAGRSSQTTAFAALAFLLGIGFYIHPISLIFSLAVMAFIAYMIFTRQPLSRRTISNLWFSVVIMIVIAAPYLIASFSTPELAGAGRLLYDSDTPRQTGWLQSAALSLNGLFLSGDLTPNFNLPGRPLLDFATGLLFLIGLITAIRFWRQPRCALILIALVFLLPIALFARRSPNFLAFSALMPMFSLLIGFGVTTLYRSFNRRLRIAAVLGVTTLLVINIASSADALFVAWANYPPVRDAYHARLGTLAHYLDQTSGSLDTVVCGSLIPIANDLLDAPRALMSMMHRRNTLIRAADCGTGLILPNGGVDAQLILPDENALDTVNPFLRAWYEAGDPIQAADLPPNSVIRINAETQLADRIGAFTTTAPVSYAPESPGGAALAALPVRLGGNLTFLGYDDTFQQRYVPGDTVPIVTYWRIDGELAPDMRLFVHILTDPAAIAVQWDDISVIPTQLRPRDVFIQVSFMQLPFSIRDGLYGVSVGAYTATDDNRLVIYDGETPRGARLFLGQLEVVRAVN